MERPLPQTVLSYLFEMDAPAAQRPALGFKAAQPSSWSFLSWGQFGAAVRSGAAALLAAGLKPGDAVGILMPSSLEWELSHFSALAAGGVVVGLDAHDTTEKLDHIMQHAEIKLLFVRDPVDGARLAQAGRDALTAMVAFRRAADGAARPERVLYWEELQAQPPRPLPELRACDAATIIYTSGSTRAPRAIRYSHGQLVFACEAIGRLWSGVDLNVRSVCWLPLSNLFQRVVNMMALQSGAEIWFVEDPRQILAQLPEIEPTVFIAVPRFYEKFAAGLRTRLDALPLTARWAARSALALSRYRQRCLRAGDPVAPLFERLHRLGDRWVLSRIRGRMGPRIQSLISGSAPLSASTLELLQAVGLPVYEAYGLSENIVPVTMNYPGRVRLGSVGRPVIAGSVRLSPGSEVLVKNPGLFSGYYRDDGPPPAFTAEGFYRTGDYGRFEEEFLFLSGRGTDFIKTSTGRRISPLPIEARLKEVNYIDHAVLCGDGRKCLSALLTVDWNLLQTAAKSSEPPPRGTAALPEPLRRLISADLRRQSAALAPAERPLGFIILRSGFSIGGGELTANLKLRRQMIAAKYQPVLDQLYRKLEEGPSEEPRLCFLTTAELRMAELAELPRLEQIATSLPVRLLSLARAAAAVAPILTWRRLRSLGRRPSVQREFKARAAQQIARVLKHELGPLKGPVAKIGQMISYLETDLPPAVQAALASLQDTTPPLQPHVIRGIIARELGRAPEQIFAEWCDVPIAAASISQLHLARRHDGRPVVVKVKYPRIERAVRSDLKALSLLAPLLGALLEISNVKELLRELQQLILAECGFRREAACQHEFRRLFAHDPDILIPEPIAELSSDRVLTMEYVDGQKFREFSATASQAQKDKAGETIFRFSCTAINRFNLFNADPHPGNYLFLDGRVCFLDFGFVKSWPLPFMRLWKQQSLAAYHQDLARFAEINRELGFGAPEGRFDYAALLELYRTTLYRPWLEDRPFRFTPEFGREQMQAIACSKQSQPMRFPPEFAAVSRVFWGIYAVLAELQAEGNWHRIVVPLLEEEAQARLEIAPLSKGLPGSGR